MYVIEAYYGMFIIVNEVCGNLHGHFKILLNYNLCVKIDFNVLKYYSNI